MNSFIVWSVDEDQSLMVTGDMYNPSWYAPLANLIAGLELSSDGFAWGSTPVTQRVVSDVVIHLNWNIALDNGTAIPLSATYERGVMTNHTPVVPLLDSPSNLEDVLSLLTVMIDNAVEACSFHPVPT
jgi:hypothetical protein